jgi:uncharacterized LabA/DUF88 family protein
MNRTVIYIDAFNLYFGALKGTPFRWLNIEKLCKVLLPNNDIYKIKYYTALVKPRKKDPNQPIRQQTYLRALKTIPNVTIIYGHFLSHEVEMPLAESIEENLRYVKVIKTEEKGSDVNIATHLIDDAYQNEYDTAVIISNDSDLLEPIRIVTERLGKIVGILNPHKYPSRVLLRYAHFYKSIRKGVLAICQFPETMKDKVGIFTKPESW